MTADISESFFPTLPSRCSGRRGFACASAFLNQPGGGAVRQRPPGASHPIGSVTASPRSVAHAGPPPRLASVAPPRYGAEHGKVLHWPDVPLRRMRLAQHEVVRALR